MRIKKKIVSITAIAVVAITLGYLYLASTPSEQKMIPLSEYNDKAGEIVSSNEVDNKIEFIPLSEYNSKAKEIMGKSSPKNILY